MPLYTFERIARTPHSEEWRIESADAPIGRVDLHFTGSKVYGTLVVQTAIAEDEIEDLISEIDARLVTTADEYREDFVVTVWRGVEFGTYAEDSPRLLDEFEDDAVTVDDEIDDEIDDELDDDLDEDDDERR